MPRRIKIVGIALATFSALVALAMLLSPSTTLSDEELRRRADTSQLTWQNYQEDIKAQIGARYVSQWRGELVDTKRDGNTIRFTFRLEEPWASRNAAIPILVREPNGDTHTVRSAEHAAPNVTYSVPLSGDPNAPWIEVFYPHKKQRVPLSVSNG